MSGAAQRIESLLASAVAEGLTTSAVAVAFAGDRQTLFEHPRGASRFAYDLASLTKPLATAALALRAMGEGSLRWDLPLAELYPPIAASRWSRLNPLHLLTHTGGFAPFAHPPAGFLTGIDWPRFRRWADESIFKDGPQATPGETTVYSDLGFLLLQRVVELAYGGQPIDRTFDRMAAPVTGNGFLTFRDLLHSWRGPAPVDSGWASDRGRRLRGEVHDPVAWMQRGIAGHAGLFGTANAVGTAMAGWLRQARGEAVWFHPELNTFALQPIEELGDGSRTAGWDTPTGEETQAGAGHPDDTIGHLAFTGCAVWWSPRQQAGAALLANRTGAGGAVKPFAEFRRSLYSELWRLF